MRYTPGMLLLILACRPSGRPSGETTAPSDDIGTDDTSDADTADTTDTAPVEVPCDTARQAWAPDRLDGHTPWFLSVDERVLMGTLHDTEPAHVLELSGDELLDRGAPAATEQAIWQIVELDGHWYGGTWPNARLVGEGEDVQ